MPKRAKSQKKMVQYSNRTKLSPVRKNGTIRKQWQNLSRVKKGWCNSQTEQICHLSEKDGTILKQGQNLSRVKKGWCNSQTEQICHQSEKDGTILKKCKNLSAVRKMWYNTQTELKPVTSQKKM